MNRSDFGIETSGRFVRSAGGRLAPVAVLFALGAILVAQTADVQQQRVQDRIATLQKEAESLAHQEQTVLVELRRLEVERQLRATELADVQREAGDVQARIAEAADRAATLAQQSANQSPELEARLVQLYKMGGAGYWRMLLDVDDLQNVGRAYRTAAALTRIDHDRAEEHRRTVAALAAERKALDERARELSSLQVKARAAQAAVDHAAAARADLVKSIDARRDLNAELTGELQDAARQLQATVARMGGGETTVTLPLRPFRGALPWPADGVVMQRFGATHGAGAALATHGIELSLAEGTPVHAVHEGTVAYAGAFAGYGDLVIVSHGGDTYSLYGHLQSLAVKKDDRVTAGSTVGLAGRNPQGNPALYFELRVDGAVVDPLQWLKRR